MADQINDYVKRPMRYENIDGLGELFFGVLWAMLMFLTLLHSTAPSSSAWRCNTTFFVSAVALAVAYLYGYKALKKRITYPRTGYVKYRSNRITIRISIAGLTAVAVAIAAVFLLRHPASYPPNMVKMALASAGWGLFYAFTTRMDSVWRWVVLLALLVIPPSVTTLPMGPLWSDTLPFVLQGLIFAISGLIALALYLRQHPVPECGAE